MPIPPAPLRPGDTIAIIPTARAIQIAELEAAIAMVQEWGLQVKLGKGIGRKHFQQAGTDVERAQDLQAALNDPQVRAVWCARGGYGTVRLLDHLDLTVLRTDPKWIVGFSDATVLHNALLRLGIPSIHGQMPFNITGKTPGCKESLLQLLTGGDPSIHLPATPSPYDRIGVADGVLVGGNLSILYALRGTPYDIDPAGKILFIEDLDELLYHLDRMIQNLRISGWFSRLSGLIVGGMTSMRNKNEEDPFGMTAEAIIHDALGDRHLPVCFGFPAGHIDDNRALLLGARVRLRVGSDRVELTYL